MVNFLIFHQMLHHDVIFEMLKYSVKTEYAGINFIISFSNTFLLSTSYVPLCIILAYIPCSYFVIIIVKIQNLLIYILPILKAGGDFASYILSKNLKGINKTKAHTDSIWFCMCLAMH